MVAVHSVPTADARFAQLPRYKTGLYITGAAITVTNSQARTSGQLTAVCVPVFRPTPIDQLALYVGTFATTGNLRLGIYADDGNGFPGALLVDGGVVTAQTPTNIKTVSISPTVTLEPGLYWFAAIHEFTGSLAVEGGTNGHAFWQYRVTPGATYANGFVITGQTTAGGFPATWSGAISATLGNPSLVCARVA